MARNTVRPPSEYVPPGDLMPLLVSTTSRVDDLERARVSTSSQLEALERSVRSLEQRRDASNKTLEDTKRALEDVSESVGKIMADQSATRKVVDSISKHMPGKNAPLLSAIAVVLSTVIHTLLAWNN